MPGVNAENLEDVFTYHPPENDDQLKAYARLREEGRRLAEAILEETPVCGDQQAAIRKVREAVMTANAAIALKGAV
jgi:hypothetical protein